MKIKRLTEVLNESSQPNRATMIEYLVDNGVKSETELSQLGDTAIFDIYTEEKNRRSSTRSIAAKSAIGSIIDTMFISLTEAEKQVDKLLSAEFESSDMTDHQVSMITKLRTDLVSKLDKIIKIID